MPPHPLAVSQLSLIVTATSKHVHNCAVQAHSHCLGASEATGPTGQVLDGDTEAATSLSHEQYSQAPGKVRTSGEHQMPGTIHCIADLYSATVVPGTHCGQETGQSHQQQGQLRQILSVEDSRGFPVSRLLWMFCPIHHSKLF